MYVWFSYMQGGTVCGERRVPARTEYKADPSIDAFHGRIVGFQDVAS
jgi:hypothetical protein